VINNYIVKKNKGGIWLSKLLEWEGGLISFGVSKNSLKIRGKGEEGGVGGR